SCVVAKEQKHKERPSIKNPVLTLEERREKIARAEKMAVGEYLIQSEMAKVCRHLPIIFDSAFVPRVAAAYLMENAGRNLYEELQAAMRLPERKAKGIGFSLNEIES